jgi:DNA excision repair protein ERCC-4
MQTLSFTSEIDFDPLKSFSLQNVNDIGADIRNDNICSKMALLVMHFPKLRILWSWSPHETLKLFKALKADHDEVDVNAAAEKGSDDVIERRWHD